MGLAGAGAMLATASTTQAGVIVSPTAVVSNSMGEPNSNRDIGNVIDRSGLSVPFVDGVSDYSAYLLTAPTHSGGKSGVDWLSSSGSPTGEIVFDLGATYTIERFLVWQSPSGIPGAQVDGITVETSLDSSFTAASVAGSFNVPVATSPSPANDVDLADSVGRYVRLKIDSNHGSATITRLGEIAFDVSSAAVPEPTSFAFLATAGLALVVRRLRPKNRKQAPV